MIAAPVLSRFMSQKFVTFIAKMSKEDLAIMGQLIAIGRVRPVSTSVIGWARLLKPSDTSNKDTLEGK
jgi:hypothetical protein